MQFLRDWCPLYVEVFSRICHFWYRSCRVVTYLGSKKRKQSKIYGQWAIQVQFCQFQAHLPDGQQSSILQRQICGCTEFLPWPWTIDTLYQIQTFTTAWVCMKAPDYIWLKWCWRGVTITKLNAPFLIHLYCCWNADKSWNGLIALIATGKYHPRPMASNLKRKGREEEKGLGKIVDRSCLDPGSQNAGHFFLENDGE